MTGVQDRTAIVAIVVSTASWVIDPVALGLSFDFGGISWASAALCGLLAAWQLQRAGKMAHLLIAAATFGTFICISALGTRDAGRSVIEALRVLSTFSVLVVVGVHRPGSSFGDLLARAIDILFAIIIGVSITLALLSLGIQGGRAYGVTAHPNILGLLSAIFALTPSARSREKVLSWRGLCRYGVGLVGVMLSQSLICFLIIGAGTAIAVLSYAWRASARNRARFWLGVACFLLAWSVPLVWVSLPSNVALGLIQGDYSSLERHYVWHESLQRFLRNPLFGDGFANVISYVREYRADIGSLRYSHSFALWYLATTGAVGIVLISGLVFLVVATIGRALRTPRTPTSFSDGWMLATAFGVLMFSSVEAGLQLMTLSWILFWCVAGLASSKTETSKVVAHRPAASPFESV